MTSGEADAGIVYTSDIASNSDVRAVTIPDDMNVIATYPIAVVTGAPHSRSGDASFVDYVTGAQGQATLAAVRVRAAAAG